MATIEEARTQLLNALADAGLRTDPTNTQRNYTDGIAYALPTNHTRTEPIAFELTIAINNAQPTQTLTQATQTAINAITRLQGWAYTDINYEHGAEPLPGREMPDADLARISVVCPHRLTHT